MVWQRTIHLRLNNGFFKFGSEILLAKLCCRIVVFFTRSTPDILPHTKYEVVALIGKWHYNNKIEAK